MEHQAYIGIGSNLQDPLNQVRQAIDHLARLRSSRLGACSSLYRSRPMGPADQPDYINAVAMLQTELSPEALLDELQAIEAVQGRLRSGERWGPRTLDLDILLFDTQRIDTPRLHVPHPGLHERPFVLYPLFEIAPGLMIPGQRALAELYAACPADGLEKITT